MCIRQVLSKVMKWHVSLTEKRNKGKRISDFDPDYGFKMPNQQCLPIGVEQHTCIVIGSY